MSILSRISSGRRAFKERTHLSRIKSLSGRVLDIGCGGGKNLSAYDPSAQIIAVDSSLRKIRRAKRHVERTFGGRARLHVEFLVADGYKLPFDSGSFDAVVVSFVLCSVARPSDLLAELSRVSKPGTAMLVLEHIRSSHPAIGALDDIFTPLHQLLFNRCRLNQRDPSPELERHGFRILEKEKLGVNSPWLSIYARLGV